MEGLFERRQVIQSILLLYLGAASAADLKKKTISIPWAVCGICTGVILKCIEGAGISGAAVAVVGVVPGLFLLAVAWITREKVGYGDGLVIMVCGAFLGLSGGMSCLMTALFFSAMASLYLLIIKKCGRKKELPFVPFILCGYIMWLCCCSDSSQTLAVGLREIMIQRMRL